jgi:hypothetical protein
VLKTFMCCKMCDKCGAIIIIYHEQFKAPEMSHEEKV